MIQEKVKELEVTHPLVILGCKTVPIKYASFEFTVVLPPEKGIEK